MDFIAGSWSETDAPDGAIEDRSPADLSMLLGRFPWAIGQAERAIQAAREAQPGFGALPQQNRARLVRRVGAILKEREEQLANAIALDVGKPLWEARLEAQACAAKAAITADEGLKLVSTFPAAGQGAAECRFRPLGVLAVLGPFNFPVHLPNGHILPALACGNTVVFKPSEIAPHAAVVYGRCLEEAGVPRGAFNLVQGGAAAGAALSAHRGVDGVLFTGSWSVGQAIAKANLGQTKMLALEMGGKNAALVLADADFDKAVSVSVSNAFLNAGQTCSAWTRMLVPRKRQDQVLEIAKRSAAKFKPGDPRSPETRLGPLASAQQRERVRKYIRAGVEQGAQLVTGGPEAPAGLPKGYYVQPTIFAGVKPEMTIAREEIFGPVLSVLPYEDDDDAVRIANDSMYGLAGGVWSGDPAHAERVARRLRTGQVDINGGRFNPLAPFGGFKQSGRGRELGKFGLEEFLEVKSLQF